MWQRKRPVLAIVAAMAGFATQVAIADDGSTGAHNKASVAQLVSIRSSEKMPWNAVVVDSRNRVIVSSPRWTGSVGPAVAIAGERGELTPFPDASWNDWKPGSDASRCFVSVNAIHADANGDLWIVDTGSPDFGGSPIENGAKIVRIDPRTDAIKRVYILPEGALRTHTYVDDVRINGTHAYLTDAGEGALLVLNLEDGSVRRHFDNAVFTHARPDDKIVVNGKVLAGADGKPLKVNADPLELSPDGRVLYFGPLSGPMSQIETRYLDDESLGERTLAEHVTPWFADMPPVGGTAMDADGSLYYTPLADNSLMRRAPDGSISTVIRDSRLRWVDAPFIDGQGNIFLPVPQIDGAPAFNHGTSTMKMPIELYRLRLPHA
ncbi:sugar lactone lactonase YvrE [Paraburkholderia bannensis]|uniref:Sugar lactone lactonase YvrE n=1 Tax=Paraburkholderia bannensis TaxID=765414 RepID=A0A7W9WSD0_9BURK|nr:MULTISPECIES: major royal jelly family protein [Paraburkholderia]MBB3261540.1 sugar lactone lactonase YvrE [Paraburkholderia sp. WP4_3_2]MBB6102146.1 sugar lactone lactonase YvrE [Paraburkholderia bannensis]